MSFQHSYRLVTLKEQIITQGHMLFSCEITLRVVQKTLKQKAICLDYVTEHHLQGQNE